ncbi:helicase assembly protein [Vibrio phage 1.244.A._10N.261.54.C3]|nr:helicase assembly protein [Vibrio phage 1.244.A._10N.261.54.C3]AUR98709.1 helicase assembly protein [Vibrio phage 1.255.O._10N.286.45.F1]
MAQEISDWEMEEYTHAFQTYLLFNAIKLHFNPNNTYNYWEHGVNERTKFETFYNRNDKYQFLKLHRRFQQRDEKYLIAHLGANLMANHKLWIGHILSEACNKRTTQYIADNDGFTYKFECWVKDNVPAICAQNNCKFMDLFKPVDGDHPWFIKAINAEAIPIPIMFGLARITGSFNTYDTAYENDFIWPELSDHFKRISGWYVFDTDMAQRQLVAWLKKNELI